MTALSICIPSHAPLTAARASIESALALLPYGDIEVVVSDNSRDPSKESFLGGLDRPGFRYLRSPYDDGFQNWRHVIDSARGEFIVLLGDDDILTVLPGFATPRSADLAGKIGFRPAHAMFSAEQGVYRPTNFAVEGATALERVQAFLIKNGGSNVTLYSAMRSEVWRNLFAGYLAHHPTRAGFTDWSLTFALVSTAPMTQETHLLYLYNSANWDSEEKIRASNQRGMAAGGLPPEADQIQMALQAVDGFVAIARSDSPVSMEDKIEAGLLVAGVYFGHFVGTLQKRFESGEKPSPKLLQTAKIALAATNPADQLIACLVIIELWLPQLREPYHKFFSEVLGPDLAKRAGLTGS
jgi:hypothetical protein